jgi:uncharacterized membrane protein
LLIDNTKSFNNKSLLKTKNILRFITFFYFIWIVFIDDFQHAYMMWNVFLAWIPLELVSFILLLTSKQRKKRNYKILICFIGILWVLFYPNSPYIITDFIHLSSNKYYIPNPDYTPYASVPRMFFNDDPAVWYDFFTISIGVWIGYITGFISLFINHKLIRSYFNKISGWLFVLLISFISGFAIYLGRFIRWNSWDVIFNPQNIVRILFSDLHGKSLLYTLLFGCFNLIIYGINYTITNLGFENK